MNFAFNNDHVGGNIFLHFGDIKTLDLPNIILEALLLATDFSNVIDLSCFKQIMKDEDLDPTFSSQKLIFMNQCGLLCSFQRIPQNVSRIGIGVDKVTN